MNIQNAYDAWSESYDTDENLTRDLDRQVLSQTLSGLHFNSILEIGCGTGKNTLLLSKIGTDVYAVDFAQRMIEKARQKIRAGNVQFSMMDITRTWKFGNDSFDLVVCNLVLEHMEDLASVFTEAVRTLTPGGQFFINELHPFRQYEGKKARFHGQGGLTEIPAFVHHISDFLGVAEMNGLRLVNLSEHWHEEDQNKPPRLISFIFENESSGSPLSASDLPTYS